MYLQNHILYYIRFPEPLSEVRTHLHSFERPTHSVAAVTSNSLRFFSVPFASQISCLPLKRSCMQASILAFPSSMLLSSCFWSSPRPISDSQLHALPHFHLCPIYLVVFKGSYYLMVGISHLEGGFTLRCLQRLSRPGLATLP